MLDLEKSCELCDSIVSEDTGTKIMGMYTGLTVIPEFSL